MQSAGKPFFRRISRKETEQMNKGFWHGIAGVVTVAVIGVAAWQFISLHERVHTLEEEMNVLLAQTQVINSQLAEINASSDKPEESGSQTVDMAGFQEALNGIGNFEQGTAGSSLKAYIAAAGLLDWLHDVGTLPTQEIEEQTYHYLNALDAVQQENFSANFDTIRQAAEQIADGTDEAKGMLTDAGNPQKYDSYSRADLDTAAGIIQKAIDGEKAA